MLAALFVRVGPETRGRLGDDTTVLSVLLTAFAADKTEDKPPVAADSTLLILLVIAEVPADNSEAARLSIAPIFVTTPRVRDGVVDCLTIELTFPDEIMAGVDVETTGAKDVSRPPMEALEMTEEKFPTRFDAGVDDGVAVATLEAPMRDAFPRGPEAITTVGTASPALETEAVGPDPVADAPLAAPVPVSKDVAPSMEPAAWDCGELSLDDGVLAAPLAFATKLERVPPPTEALGSGEVTPVESALPAPVAGASGAPIVAADG
jgi:hypothetical protein